MEKILLIASGNSHKVEEIRAIFAAQGLTDWELRSLAAYPGHVPPPEDGDSFKANAAIKAQDGAALSGLLTLADDSGLCVDHLQGGPGIHSARYAGTGKDADNRKKLLAALADVPEQQRGAAFVCQACLAWPAETGRELWFGAGRCGGRIGFREQGTNGFGYDSLFYVPELGCTLAQLQPEKKNTLSHRFRAMTLVAQYLRSLTEE